MGLSAKAQVTSDGQIAHVQEFETLHAGPVARYMLQHIASLDGFRTSERSAEFAKRVALVKLGTSASCLVPDRSDVMPPSAWTSFQCRRYTN